MFKGRMYEATDSPRQLAGESVVQAIFHEIISLLPFENCNFIQNENY